jgi:gamma-glutamyltranspeptidase/glutathione hydrolase
MNGGVFRKFALLLWSALCIPPAHAGVVAAENPAAAVVGRDVLAEGGSAVDAAIATALAGCVVHATSCGIGGGGFLVVYDAGTGKGTALDFRETAPKGSREDLYIQDGKFVRERSLRGPLAVGVPGEIAGLFEAHQRFGRLPWKRLVEPAAKLASEGFEVTPHMARQLASRREAIAGDPELASALLGADRRPPTAGEKLVMENLGKTLHAVAERGPDAFYDGPIAASIAETIQSAGGVMTLEDLRDYRPVWREPLETEYRGYQILTMPPPSAGGTAIILALDTLSAMDAKSMAPNSARRWHTYAEILQHAFADRAVVSGDPAFDPPRPPADGARVRERIDPERTLAPERYGTMGASAAPPPDDAGTAHVSVIADDGSAAALTSTINTSFGSLLGARGSGVILNNELDDFSFPIANAWGLEPAPTNRIQPGKRPTSSMSPTIAVRDGRAVVAVGASGGPLIISATLEVLTNVLDYGLEAREAVASPRIHHQWKPRVLLVEPGVPPEERARLEGFGHQLREIPGVAAVSLATALPGAGFAGAGDPRKGGSAELGNGGDGQRTKCQHSEDPAECRAE